MSSPPVPLPLRHALLALLVMAVWGSNFAVIHIGLEHLPPLLFAALRFTFALLPAIFFVRRPGVGWRALATYGLLIGAGQFGLLYIAMNGHITPGLASLVVQLQVFFTIGLAMYFGGELIKPFQVAALTLALAGLAVIIAHTDGQTTLLGLLLVLIAAFCWAGGNIVARNTRSRDMLAFVVWASLFSAVPLWLMSLTFEGASALGRGLLAANGATWAAVLWQAAGNTLFGYAVWGWLLGQYPAATIAPMSLLVPVFGMAASTLWLGEPLQSWKLAAAGLVMAGLCLNLLWLRLAVRRAARVPPAM